MQFSIAPMKAVIINHVNQLQYQINGKLNMVQWPAPSCDIIRNENRATKTHKTLISVSKSSQTMLLYHKAQLYCLGQQQGQ